MIILVIVLAVLIGIYLIQNLSSDKMTVSESLLDIYADLNSSNVTSIKVYKQLFPDSGLVFNKTDGQWVLSSYYSAPAKESEIDKLFTDIKNIKGEIRSANQELFTDYDITDDQALHLEFLGSDGSEIAHVLFGKGVPQASRSSFIRNANSDTVYMANENFISRFAMWNAEPSKRITPKRWVELSLAEFDREAAKSIEVEKGKSTYLFEKEEVIVPGDSLETTKSVWKQTKPAQNPVEEKKITDMLGRLANFRATEIVAGEPSPEHKLGKTGYSVGVTLEDGTNYRFIFGAETDTTSGSYYVQVEGKPFVYKMAKFVYESIFVNPFKKE